MQVFLARWNDQEVAVKKLKDEIGPSATSGEDDPAMEAVKKASVRRQHPAPRHGRWA